MDKRISWIDAAKGIGIFFVIFGHYCGDDILRMHIYSFHMPLFFFLAGYVFNSDKYNEYSFFLKRKTYSLILPFIYFTLILAFFLGIQTNDLTIQTMMKRLLLIDEKYAGEVLWFLPAIFWAENILFFLVNFLGKNIKALFFSLFIILTLHYFTYSFLYDWYLPLSLKVSFMSAFFLVSGFIAKIISERFKVHFLWMVVFFLLNIFFSYYNFYGNTADMRIGFYGNYIYFFIAAFSGIGFYLILARWLSNLPFVTYLGENTIIILAMHGLFWRMFEIYGRNQLESLIWSIVTIILSVPIIYYIDKFLPFMAGKPIFYAKSSSR